MSDFLEKIKQTQTQQAGQRQAEDSLNKIIRAIDAKASPDDVKQLAVSLERLSGDLGVALAQLQNKAPDNKQLIKTLAELSTAISAIEVNPVINVPEPKVVINERKIDTSAITEAIAGIEFNPTITIPEAKVVVNEKEVDFKPLIARFAVLEKAIKGIKLDVPIADNSDLRSAVEATTKAINELQFPVTNYILPFSKDGKATQLELDESGTALPTTDLAYATQIDEASDTLTYIGKASPGTATSDELWQIKRIDSTSGTSITWASGNSNFNKVWDDRASLTYS